MLSLTRHIIPALVGPSSCWARYPRIVGAKGARLAQLQRMGLRIPPFFIITTTALSHFKRREDLAVAIERACTGLQKKFPHFAFSGEWAVRSSAACEDQQAHSFAGLFATFLRVPSAELSQRVVACCRCVDSPRVRAYAEGGDLGARPISLAVIVQAMVQPHYAGVLFTAHPLTHDRRNWYAEVVPSLGEALVSGEAAPVQIDIDATTGQIFFSQPIGLPLAVVHHLREQAAQIELFYKSPQDIEFAVQSDTLFLLQTRPITHPFARERIIQDPDGTRYSDYFFAERFVEPLSPLGWSILAQAIEQTAFRDPLRFLGYDELASSEKPLLRLIEGRPHANWDAFRKLFLLIPASLLPADKRLLFKRGDWAHGLFAERMRRIPYLLVRLAFRDDNWIPARHLENWRLFENSSSPDLQTRPRLQEMATLQRSVHQLLSLHRWSLLFADFFYKLLQEFSKRFVKDEGNSCDQLLMGLPENKTTQMNLDLTQLPIDPIPAMNPAWEQFFRQYGHRSASLDIAQPTWRENPLQIMASLRLHQDNGEKRPRGGAWNDAEERCRQRLMSAYPLVVALALNKCFMYILANARSFAVLRENQRDLLQQILAALRSHYLERGRRLQEAGMLDQAADIFYLERGEVDALEGNVAGETKETIQRRKAPQERRDARHSGRTPTAGRRPYKLTGIGVSRGEVTAAAYVAHTWSEALRVPAHAILVCPSVDPGWTPLFARLDGLILEVGGVLSHASILAREFSLPAITSVPAATRLIQSGDLLYLNGASGEIRLLGFSS